MFNKLLEKLRFIIHKKKDMSKDMSESYWLEKMKNDIWIDIYKGEGRILIVPFFNGRTTAKCYPVNDVDNAKKIGETIFESIDFIKNTWEYIMNNSIEYIENNPYPDLDSSDWMKNSNSKYKSATAFWKNNNISTFQFDYGDTQYSIDSLTKRLGKYGQDYEFLEAFHLPLTASAEEIGQTIIKSFEVTEEYYKTHKDEPKPKIKTSEIALLDDAETLLEYKLPLEKYWDDMQDCNAGEIYQCYGHLSESEEELALMFFGIAAELDIDMSDSKIKEAWTKMHGEPDFFETTDVKDKVFVKRAEFKNKAIHKIAYLFDHKEDLLLDFSLEVYQPNRRKKKDERFTLEFEEIASSCKFKENSKEKE